LGPVPNKRRLPDSVTKSLAYPSLGTAERAKYLREREREAFGELLPEHEPTMYEIHGARSISGKIAVTENGDGRKLGSHWARDAGSAQLNKAITRRGKEKIKRQPKDETELRKAMTADAKILQKISHRYDDTMPDTSPAILKARKAADAAYRKAKPRKRTPTPRRRRPR
jgi:hypothetical protein